MKTGLPGYHLAAYPGGPLSEYYVCFGMLGAGRSFRGVAIRPVQVLRQNGSTRKRSPTNEPPGTSRRAASGRRSSTPSTESSREGAARRAGAHCAGSTANLMSIQFLFMQVNSELYPEKNPFSLADAGRLRSFDKVAGATA